jgi:hypothetical protein
VTSVHLIAADFISISFISIATLADLLQKVSRKHNSSYRSMVFVVCYLTSSLMVQLIISVAFDL